MTNIPFSCSSFSQEKMNNEEFFLLIVVKAETSFNKGEGGLSNLFAYLRKQQFSISLLVFKIKLTRVCCRIFIAIASFVTTKLGKSESHSFAIFSKY